MEKKQKNKEIAIYQAKSGAIELALDNKEQTFYLTQQQVADIFDVQKAAISKHVKNIFDSGELSEKATVSKMETVQLEGKRKIKRELEYYNLDLVLSIGYRVNSTKATKFRQWATKTLKDYIVKGYAINEKRLLEAREKFAQLQNAIAFLKEKSKKDALSDKQSEILDLLASYSKTFTLLDEYDKGTLKQAKGGKGTFALTYEDCLDSIQKVKKGLVAIGEAGELFGNEKDNSFEGIIKGLYQTFGGKELYSTLELKVAHVLYLVIKDHPFSDGNKRTASFLFVYFLNKNKALHRDSGEKKINDNALAALALLIAESDPAEKDQMIALITQLIA